MLLLYKATPKPVSSTSCLYCSSSTGGKENSCSYLWVPMPQARMYFSVLWKRPDLKRAKQAKLSKTMSLEAVKHMQHNISSFTSSTEEPLLLRKSHGCHWHHEALHELKLHPASLPNEAAELCHLWAQATLAFARLSAKAGQLGHKQHTPASTAAFIESCLWEPLLTSHGRLYPAGLCRAACARSN